MSRAHAEGRGPWRVRVLDNEVGQCTVAYVPGRRPSGSVAVRHVVLAPARLPANKSLEPTAENVAKIIHTLLFRLRTSLVLWSMAAAHLKRSPAFSALLCGGRCHMDLL